MTSMPSASSASGPSNSVSTGPAADTKTFLAAALLTYGAGMTVLVCAQLLGVFGGFLGVVAAVVGLVWWYKVQGQMLPRRLSTAALVVLIIVSGGLSLLAWGLA